MKNDDDYLDPILEQHRVHIPAEFSDMVTTMDAVTLRRRRDEAADQNAPAGVAYFDAVMSNFFSPVQ